MWGRENGVARGWGGRGGWQHSTQERGEGGGGHRAEISGHAGVPCPTPSHSLPPAPGHDPAPRRPGSSPGVIFRAPVPNSRSTYSSAMMRMRRPPLCGTTASRPTRCLYLQGSARVGAGGGRLSGAAGCSRLERRVVEGRHAAAAPCSSHLSTPAAQAPHSPAPLVLWVHRHRGVAQYRLGPGGGHRQVLVAVCSGARWGEAGGAREHEWAGSTGCIALERSPSFPGPSPCTASPSCTARAQHMHGVRSMHSARSAPATGYLK